MDSIAQAGVLIIAAILLLLLGYFLFFGPMRIEKATALKKGPKGRSYKTCPLCSVELRPGENLKSEVYPGSFGRLTHIWGCPFCYPTNAEYRRICPVCKKEVPREGKVFARLFEKGNRHHVHVLGCSSCRKM